MKYLFYLALLPGVLLAGPYQEGEVAFNEGDFNKAAEQFAEALKSDPKNVDLMYNLGTSYYRAGKYEEAEKPLKSVALTADSIMSLKSWSALGNNYFRRAVAQQELPAKISGLKEAVTAYKECIIKGSQDPKIAMNLEYAQLKLKEAIDQQKQDQENNQDNKDQDQPEPSPEAKQVLQKALALVAQGYYTDAREILADIIQRDETAQNYKSHLQRIEDMVDISQGRRPERSFDHSNADNDLEVL